MNNEKILAYTRVPSNDYTVLLSSSVHFAISHDDNGFRPLNKNYGVLFAKATISEKNTINAKGIKNPYIFNINGGGYGIAAVRTNEQGEDDTESKGQILLWTSKDLVDFHDCGLIKLHDEKYVNEVSCEFNSIDNVYEIVWSDNESNSYITKIRDFSKKSEITETETTKALLIKKPEVTLKDVFVGNAVEISPQTAQELKSHWDVIYNTEIRIPESASVSSAEQLSSIKAAAVYSDGSMAEKDVVWDTSGIDFSKHGSYIVNGKVTQPDYPFPLAEGYADPVILPFNGKYYFLATNDNKNDIGLYVRESETISGLFSPDFKESLILDVNEESNYIQTFWAPEFHFINGELYILFAVGGKVWGPQCHMMKLKKGGNITDPKSWENPVRVKKADGSNLTEDGITLDMTHFAVESGSYLVWSYRKGIGTPKDTGSMLYIAKTNEATPWVLTSEPVLLSRPLYGWENHQGTINNEGPYALITDDNVYITYSGGAAGGYTYALGLLTIPRRSDYLKADCWKKSITPVLSYYSANGVYGPGHNSFFKDTDGNVMIMYHGEKELTVSGTRCTAMHRVHFNKDGNPIFNLTRDIDLNEGLTDVTIKIIV